MKIFISQAMHGKSLEEIKAIREEYVQAFKKEPIAQGKEIEVINNLQEDYDPGDCNYPRLAYLGNSINMMKDVDLVLLIMSGIDDSPGCKIEIDVCLRYNIPRALAWKDPENVDQETIVFDYIGVQNDEQCD